MMNQFGQAYVEGSTAAAMYPLYDVRTAMLNRQRFRREAIPELEKANSFTLNSGRTPSTGWILLARSDYDKLNKYSVTLRLDIGDTTNPNNTGSLTNLSIVQAQCVTRGIATDANALYLVELTDRRGLAANKWFQYPVLARYNIRAPAYPQTFEPSSMNGGTTWTWTTMLQNLWESMSDFLGTWPGLPITPAGTPEGFWMIGVSAWHQLNNILDHLGLEIACDLTQAATSQFTIVDKSVADTAFTAKQTKYATNLEDDLEWIDVGAGRVPVEIVVFFKRRNSIYGSEETVRYDNFQWDTTTAAFVTVVATNYPNAVGTHHIWSDFTVRYDQDSQPISADVSMATSIAQERAAQYLARINPNGRMKQTYAGALPFTTGSDVDCVHWYQDYRSENYQGWRTEITHDFDGYMEGGNG